LEHIKRDKHLWLALLMGLTIILVAILPRLLNPYSTEDDFLNWYWMNLFYDPNLFPKDYVIERSLLKLAVGPVNLFIYKNSPLYGLLFQMFSPLLHFILLGKLLVFPLAALSIYYLYRISERFASPAAAMTICLSFVLLNLILPSLVSIMGGFQRSFALPLLLAFSYYWWQKRYGLACIVLFLAGGIYPPLFVVLIVAALLELLLSWWTDRHTAAGRHYGLYLVGIILLGFVMLGLLWPGIETRFLSAFVDSTTGRLSLADDGRYGPYGRANLFTIFPLVGRGGISDHGMTSVVLLFLTLFASTIGVWQPQRWRGFPRIFKTLLLASFISFALAWAGFFLTAAFPFYLPSRYTQAVLLLVLFVFVMVNAPDALQAAARWVMGNRPVLLGLNLLIAGFCLLLFFYLPVTQAGVATFGRGTSRWLLLVLAVLLVVLTVIIYRRPQANSPLFPTASWEIGARGRTIGVGLLILVTIVVVWASRPFMDYTYYSASTMEKNLHAYVQTLPKDNLIAGSAHVNSMPMFGQRSAFLTYERLGPDDTAIVAALLAYYTDDPAELIAFCDTYDIDYLAVYEQDFIRIKEEGRLYFYEPYHSIVASQIGRRTTFFLETVPDSVKDYHQDGWSVVACTEEILRP
jgi:hypothetical protein